MKDAIEGRKVGEATGETTYREVMVRSEFADGTVVDSEPVRMEPHIRVTWGNLAGALMDRKPKPVRTVRYERSVTVYASEWVPTPEPKREPLVDVDALREATEGNSAGLPS
jgi:hypothetical protein